MIIRSTSRIGGRGPEPALTRERRAPGPGNGRGAGESSTPSSDRGVKMLSEQEATKITQVAAIVGLAVGLLAVAV